VLIQREHYAPNEVDGDVINVPGTFDSPLQIPDLIGIRVAAISITRVLTCTFHRRSDAICSAGTGREYRFSNSPCYRDEERVTTKSHL
jgi:hypothetical protein